MFWPYQSNNNPHNKCEITVLIIYLVNAESHFQKKRETAINNTLNSNSQQLEVLGTLTAQITHELNNPIDAMTRFVRMAKSQLDNGQLEKTAAYLDNIETGLSQMATTLNELLAFSRPVDSNSKKSCLNEILQQSIMMFESAAEDKNLQITTQLSSKTLFIVPGLLPGVFNNIIKNAIEATDHGSITIKSELDDEFAIINIRDTGPGIPEQYIYDIFKPFFTTKKESGGTGLGLAISKEIVERSGGAISVFNRPEGGCEFEICIPVVNSL